METRVLGHLRSWEITGDHERSREITGTHGLVDARVLGHRERLGAAGQLVDVLIPQRRHGVEDVPAVHVQERYVARLGGAREVRRARIPGGRPWEVSVEGS